MIDQSEPITMWFDRRLALRQSPIQGIGTFVTGEASHATTHHRTHHWRQ